MGQRICALCGEMNFNKNTRCRKCGINLPPERKNPNYMGREH